MIQANSRVFMHHCLVKIWELKGHVYSIENDALYFSLPKNVSVPFKFSQAFGHFKNELENCDIEMFVSFGQKSNSIVYTDFSGQRQQDVKAYGFSLQGTLVQNILSQISFQDLPFQALHGQKKISHTTPNTTKKKYYNNFHSRVHNHVSVF